MLINFFLVFVFVQNVQSRSGELEKYGPFDLIINSRVVKCNHDKDLDLDVSGISVHFYDFSRDINLTYQIDDAATKILGDHELRRSMKRKNWVVYVPGFNSPSDGKGNTYMRNAFKKLETSYYIIIDHFIYTSVKKSYRDSYESSVTYAYDIARAVSRFLNDLTDGGVPLNSIRCIGHSLGSQILGYIGFNFKEMTGQTLKRITALDPAGPCFTDALIQEQIRSGAAQYVEVFHCNAGGFGTRSVLGDVDFFANDKGEFQPGCHVPLIPGIHDSEEAAKCSHDQCIDIFATTINHRDWFPAKKCESYKDFVRGLCEDDGTIAGFWNPGIAKGVYYFSSKDEILDDFFYENMSTK